MADVGRVPGTGVPSRYLEMIENTIDSGPVVRDHPLTTGPSATLPDTPSTLDDLGRREPALAPPGHTAIERVRQGDAGPGAPDLRRVEQLIKQARTEAKRARVPLHSLHQGVVALRSAVYDHILLGAQEARQAHLDKVGPDGRQSSVQGGFTVTPDAIAGWHVLVHNGMGLRTAFDADGRWTLREFKLGDPPASIGPGLRVVATRTWDEAGQEELRYRFSHEDSTSDLDVETVPPDSPEYGHGPFVITGSASGHRHHFAWEGTFTARDVPVYREAYLRSDVLADAPRLVDVRGAIRDDWTVERLPDRT
ncbi:hypothetical protein, partial [Kutzneria sp. 744]|uniref:hypothetical protein n=1 Tax=Kutzneria sp. (strain 744) TaxID=345341 RepID=UPI0005B93EEB